MEDHFDTEVAKPPAKDLKLLSDEQSRRVVESVKGAEVSKHKIGVIDQIDGQTSESLTVTFDLEHSENPVNKSQDSSELVEEIGVKDVEKMDIDEIATKINALLIKEKINSSPGDILLQKATPSYK